MIINADDFGFSQATNEAILASFAERLISSTTLMANMPGFEHACQRAHELGLIDHIGMHLVLDAGSPLSEPIKRQKRFCDADGRLCFSRARPVLHIDRHEREALASEIRAQLRRLRQYGMRPTHFDSHHHVHTEWSIGGVLIGVAREEHIPYIRLARNCDTPVASRKGWYKRLYNARLRRAGVAGTRYFGSIDDFRSLKKRLGGRPVHEPYEVMVHPVFDAHGQLLDGLRAEPLRQAIQAIDHHQLAVPYGQR